jgi:NDP-sugar pyrophosphorylase family protein
MDGLILAAGYGNRLRSITAHIPKPLLPIIHTPLIDVVFAQLKKWNIDRVAVNLFHRNIEIKEHLIRYDSAIHIAIEPVLRGTGGALTNFSELFKEDFIMHACDVLSDINIHELIDTHHDSHAVATLCLTKRTGTNTIELNGHRVTGVADISSDAAFTYAGIAVFSPEVFTFLPHKESFSIVEVFKTILSHGMLICGVPMPMSWFNINSAYKYWRIHQALMSEKVRFPTVGVSGEVSIHDSSTVDTKALSGFVLVGKNCSIDKDSALQNAIVFDNTTLRGVACQNCLISDNFCVQINKD